ncbi:MAG: pyridoxal-phosphate-dependent aminotransferase family protein [Chloroflexia bacterium]
MKDRKLLMIPGPIEFTPEVLRAMGLAPTSHLAANFVRVFGEALRGLRELFLCPNGQPFVVAGSGTLAMDMAAANLVEPGDRALVVNTGYFSDRFAAILRRYGAEVTEVKAPEIGATPAPETVEEALRGGRFKLMTVTHVDTSTGVLADVRTLAGLARAYEALILVDGVCSLAGEEMRQEEWGIDLVLTASQKAIGVPPGLALVVAGPRAVETFRRRRIPVANYYADWSEWLPIMQAYESGQARYFATPAVNLVWALHVSLEQILSEGLEARFARHRLLARAFQAGMTALGLELVPRSPEVRAHTMSAIYYPEGVDASALAHIQEAGVIVAGGLHPEIRARYFRVGHMGAVSASDILATVGAIEHGLARAGYRFQAGAGVATVQAILLSNT